MTELILPPPSQLASQHRYRLTRRKKRSFRTILSTAEAIDPTAAKDARVTISGQASVELTFDYPLIRGRIAETLELAAQGDRLVTNRLVRSVFNTADQRIRHEEVDFSDDSLFLPQASYPEVALPFLLAWQPFDGKIRDLYAWINDRFVARVEYQIKKGTTKLELPGGEVQAVKGVMYPDFNDWVPLGKIVTKLVRPFVPKYHMWFDPEPPHTVLRFEGPYGPPGAPEIVMERL